VYFFSVNVLTVLKSLNGRNTSTAVYWHDNHWMPVSESAWWTVCYKHWHVLLFTQCCGLHLISHSSSLWLCNYQLGSTTIIAMWIYSVTLHTFTVTVCHSSPDQQIILLIPFCVFGRDRMSLEVSDGHQIWMKYWSHGTLNSSCLCMFWWTGCHVMWNCNMNFEPLRHFHISPYLIIYTSHIHQSQCYWSIPCRLTVVSSVDIEELSDSYCEFELLSDFRLIWSKRVCLIQSFNGIPDHQ